MRLYEHEAKKLLTMEGVKVPRKFGLVSTPQAAKALKSKFPAMIKAQVLIGGRGKAGGIQRVDSAAAAQSAASKMLSAPIRGCQVKELLVEEALDFSASFYLGVTCNPATSNNILIAGSIGGVDIEETALTRPESILRIELPDSPDTLPADRAREIAAFLAKSLPNAAAIEPALADVASRVYAAYCKRDCKVLEINPLFITAAGPVAADAKAVLDDNALYRQGDFLAELHIKEKRHEDSESTSRERRASAGGFAYIDLLPENVQRAPGKIYVGLVPGGAGYGIFSIDEVAGIGDKFFDGRLVPVNFMDSGGGPTRQSVAEMFSLLMDWPLVDVIITSRFGGISSCDIFIRGLVECLQKRQAEKKRCVPVYGRMVGTDLSAARVFLEAAKRDMPEVVAGLSMVVGNREIMAEVIRKGIADFIAKKQ